MFQRVFPGLAILAGLVLGSPAGAIEPDGRVAFRYDWPETQDGDPGPPRLRLSITSVAALAEARVVATLPNGIGLIVHAAGRAPAPWSSEGLAIGELAAGETIVLEFDVARPARGGGIVGFSLQATENGRAVREGVGVVVGEPGTAPTLRNGAVEFPAAREEPAP